MNLPPPPYDDTIALVKIQALVSDKDKDLLMTVIPDRGLYTLLIQHALKRTADFIRHHDLEYSNPEDQLVLAKFITCSHEDYDTVRGPATPRAFGKAVTRDVSGRTEGLRGSSTSVSDLSPNLRKSNKGTGGKKA